MDRRFALLALLPLAFLSACGHLTIHAPVINIPTTAPPGGWSLACRVLTTADLQRAGLNADGKGPPESPVYWFYLKPTECDYDYLVSQGSSQFPTTQLLDVVVLTHVTADMYQQVRGLLPNVGPNGDAPSVGLGDQSAYDNDEPPAGYSGVGEGVLLVRKGTTLVWMRSQDTTVLGESQLMTLMTAALARV